MRQFSSLSFPVFFSFSELIGGFVIVPEFLTAFK